MKRFFLFIFFVAPALLKIVLQVLPFGKDLGWASSCSAQGTWTQKANFGGIARCDAVGFSIGTKGYLGTGVANGVFHNDFWEWDQATDTWTQKANYPGLGLNVPVGFSIGNKGYVGTGADNVNNVHRDFWEYNPGTNMWTQKANFGGVARFGAVGFSIGNRGYAGTGIDGTLSNTLNDFWEYNPVTNTWTQKQDYLGGFIGDASAFSIGTKGYIGTGGHHFTNGTNDFWEYNPIVDTWIQKANFPGIGRMYAVGLAIGQYGYIGTGDSSAAGTHSFSDFWQYNPNTNTWVQMSDFGGGIRWGSVAFTIGCKGYIGTGAVYINNSQTSKNDFWEFTPPFPSAAIAGVNNICSGDSTMLFASGGLSYQWSNSGTTNSISVAPTVTTNYSVTVSDVCGSSSTNMTVTVTPSPTASFENIVDRCTHCVQLTDNSINENYFLWNFGDGDTSSQKSSNHCYKDTGVYTVSLSVNSNSLCKSNLSIVVPVRDYVLNPIVPNVFTPNGDGINDEFKISGLDNCSSYSIKIYNRWGIPVFETSKPDFVWDGKTTAGTKAEEGTYYYVLKNSTATKTGFVTLLR